MTKVIVRIKGGLGNQLFCYAAARRLALVNNAELVIDDVTGFARDIQYHRKYALEHFCIPVRKASKAERLEPFARCRRGIMKLLSRRKPFAKRQYLEQEGLDFDARLLSLKIKNTIFLEGYWQSENYFKDVEQIIRKDLCVIPPKDALNLRVAEQIRNSNAVALHVRWFDIPGVTSINNVSLAYYRRAIAYLEKTIISPHYLLFSDNPDAALAQLSLTGKRVTVIKHNTGDDNAYADMWLMSQCHHFVTANSTFSWWGAWLGERKDRL